MKTMAETFIDNFRQLSLSKDRLNRTCLKLHLEGSSKQYIINTYKEYGLSNEDAEIAYNNMIEILSKFHIHCGFNKHSKT